MDRGVNGWSDYGVESSVKESKLKQEHGVHLKGMFINEQRIYKTIRGSRVYKCGERRNLIRQERDKGHKRFGI